MNAGYGMKQLYYIQLLVVLVYFEIQVLLQSCSVQTSQINTDEVSQLQT